MAGRLMRDESEDDMKIYQWPLKMVSAYYAREYCRKILRLSSDCSRIEASGTSVIAP